MLLTSDRPPRPVGADKQVLRGMAAVAMVSAAALAAAMVAAMPLTGLGLSFTSTISEQPTPQ